MNPFENNPVVPEKSGTVTKPLRIDGIDLSHFQTQSIDYAAAKKAGVKFVYNKATESTTWADPSYTRRRREAKAAGIFFGAYHFARPALGTAVAEANWFLKVAQPVPGNMLPALDLEVNDHNLTEAQLSVWVNAWWTTVQKALGIKTGVTYTHFNLTTTANTYLWAPRYSNNNTPPTVPSPWKNFDIRQFSDGKFGVPNSVPGVGHVDINHIRDGFLGLHKVGWEKKLVIPEPVKPPTPPPPPAPVQHRVSTMNVEFGHRPVDKWAAMILDRFETLKIDVFAIEEGQDYFAALKPLAEAKGHTLLGHGTNSRNALLVRKGHKVGPVGTVPGKVTTWFTPSGHTQSMAQPVVATVDGVTYVVIHAPVDAWVVGKGGRTLTGPANRVQAYKDFTYNLVKFLGTVSGPVVVLGDWNATPDTKGTYSPLWVETQTKSAFARPNQTTGHGEIDFGIVRGASKIGKATVIPQTQFLVPGETGGSESGEHSDHMQVWFELTY